MTAPDPHRSEPESVADVFASLGIPLGSERTADAAARPGPRADIVAATSTSAHAPLTRREIRERERQAEEAAATQRAPRPERANRTPASRPLRRATADRRAERTRRTPSVRTVGSRLLSVGAMLIAGALAVGMSLPATAFSTASATAQTAGVMSSTDAQTIGAAADVAASSTARDGYSVTSWAQMLTQRYGTRTFDYTVNSASTIRWPFPYYVPISSGYGARNAPCRACSSVHLGIDFVPGIGSPIYSVADATVEVHDQSGPFGNHVELTMQFQGKTVQFLYAHMIFGSSTLKSGDKIKAGDLIGLVGQTGTATGPHLHFEVIIDGQHVDPFTFLKTYAS